MELIAADEPCLPKHCYCCKYESHFKKWHKQVFLAVLSLLYYWVSNTLALCSKPHLLLASLAVAAFSMSRSVRNFKKLQVICTVLQLLCSLIVYSRKPKAPIDQCKSLKVRGVGGRGGEVAIGGDLTLSHARWGISSSPCGRGWDVTHNFAPNSLICHGYRKVFKLYSCVSWDGIRKGVFLPC